MLPILCSLALMLLVWWLTRSRTNETQPEELSLAVVSRHWTSESAERVVADAVLPPPLLNDPALISFVEQFRPFYTHFAAELSLFDHLTSWYDRHARLIPSVADGCPREPELRFTEQERLVLKRQSLLEHILAVAQVVGPELSDTDALLFSLTLLVADWGMLPAETVPSTVVTDGVAHQAISLAALKQWHDQDPLSLYDQLSQAVLEHHRPRPKTPVGKMVQRGIDQVRRAQLASGCIEEPNPPLEKGVPLTIPTPPVPSTPTPAARVSLDYLVSWLRLELAREVNQVEQTSSGPRWRLLCFDKQRVLISPENLWELIQRCPARQAPPRPFSPAGLARLLPALVRHGLITEQDAEAGPQPAVVVTPRGREIKAQFIIIQASSLSSDPASFLLRRDQQIYRMVRYVRFHGEQP